MKSRAFTDSPLFYSGHLIGSPLCSLLLFFFHLIILFLFFLRCDLHRGSCLEIKAHFFPGVSFIVDRPGVCLCVFVVRSCTLPGQLGSAVLLCPSHLMVWRGGVVYIRPGAV